MSTQELDRPTAGDPPPPPAKPPRARTMPVGRVAVVGVVALAVAALLNSSTLLDMAEGLPAGSRTRSVATGVARPLHDFASAVGLTRPREWLDSALGRDDADPSVVAVVGPTTTAPASATTAPPTSAVAPATTTRAAPNTIVMPGQDPATTMAPGASAPPASQAPLPAGTAKVLIAGDSMAQGLQAMMEPLMDEAGGYQADGIAKAATGLTRPDYFDWPARLKQAGAEFDPGIVVLMFGGNDGQPIQDASGKYYQPTDPGWSVEYAKRVGALMDQLGDEGRRVVWVGSPIAKTANFSQRLKIINTVIEQQASTHPWVHYVDAWSLFLGPKGGWTASLTDTDGKVKKMRGGDGYHLTIDGYKRLARAVFAEVQEVKATGKLTLGAAAQPGRWRRGKRQRRAAVRLGRAQRRPCRTIITTGSGRAP